MFWGSSRKWAPSFMTSMSHCKFSRYVGPESSSSGVRLPRFKPQVRPSCLWTLGKLFNLSNKVFHFSCLWDRNNHSAHFQCHNEKRALVVCLACNKHLIHIGYCYFFFSFHMCPCFFFCLKHSLEGVWRWETYLSLNPGLKSLCGPGKITYLLSHLTSTSMKLVCPFWPAEVL